MLLEGGSNIGKWRAVDKKELEDSADWLNNGKGAKVEKFCGALTGDC